MEYITRKSLVYKTKVEYGDYTINHIEGCSHGCNYPCYAMLMAKRFGKVKNYNDWITPKLVSNTLELLDAELPKLKDKIGTIHLCFTTDPFMYGNKEIIVMSLKAIKKINSFGIKCSVLTKGILPQRLSKLGPATEPRSGEGSPLAKANSYGITLISLDEEFRSKMEPFSAPYLDRIKSLKQLKDKGFNAWVSIEPYPTPNIVKQNISSILENISFVDKIIFGRLNYNKQVSEYEEAKEFFNKTAKEVITFCKEKGISYHIKNGTITKKVKV
jgi:DNA repair photolyase